MSPANSVTKTVFNRPGMGPWCVVQCHVDPSTSIYAAWNPERDLLHCSPGYLGAVVPSTERGILVTVFRPHCGTPADAPDALYVNETRLSDIPPYAWKLKQADASGLVLAGTSKQGKPMAAELVCSGQWLSPAGKRYEVYYLFFTIQMPVRHTNIRGHHRIFFVRDGMVVRSADCSDRIIVQDGELLQRNMGGLFGPWSEAKFQTKGL